MDLSLISAEAWKTLRTRYPGAWDLLVHDSLIGEKAALKRELAAGIAHPGRLAWVTSRIAELEYFDNLEPTHRKDTQP